MSLHSLYGRQKTGHSRTRVEYNGKVYVVGLHLEIANDVCVRYWHPKLTWVERRIWYRTQPRTKKIDDIIRLALDKRDAKERTASQEVPRG